MTTLTQSGDPGLVEVVENQRFFAAWFPSVQPISGYGWPPWSDSQGNPVELSRPPTVDGQGGWFVIRTAGTDEDGWLYGTAFERLSHSRPGGRAAKRGGDTVRSRVWRRLLSDRELEPIQPSAASVAAAGHTVVTTLRQESISARVPAAASAQFSQITESQILSALSTNYTYKQQRKASVFEIWKAFMELWNESAQRNNVKLLHMDPVALFTITRAHRALATTNRRKVIQTSPDLLIGLSPTSPTRPGNNPAGSPADPGLAGLLVSKSINSWIQLTPKAADLITKGPMAGFDWSAAMLSGLTAQGSKGTQGVGGKGVSDSGVVLPGVLPGPDAPEPLHAEGLEAAEVRHHNKVQVVGSTPAHPSRHARRPIHSPYARESADALPKPRAHSEPQAAEVAEPAQPHAHAAPGTPTRSGAARALGRLSKAGDHKHGFHWRWPWQHDEASHASHAGSARSSLEGSGAVTPRRMTLLPRGPLLSRVFEDEAVAPVSLLPSLNNPTALVEELLTILNYARAAYGYVMAAGHMANLSTFINLVGMSAWFNPVTGASVEANNEAIHALTGIPQSDILLASWRNHTFQPCHFLAVDRAHGRLVLSIRGSLELGDICTDLAAQPRTIHVGGLGSCHAHTGVIAAAESVLHSCEEALHKALRDYPDWPLLITGHSLGAGVASMLTIMMRYGYGHGPHAHPSEWADRVFCVAVACPPLVSEHVANSCDDFMLSLVHNMDFVPRLSHMSVELAMMEIARGSPLTALADNLSSAVNKLKGTLPWANNSAAAGPAAAAAGATPSTGGRTAMDADVAQDADMAAWVRAAGAGAAQRSLDPELAHEVLYPPAPTAEVELTPQQHMGTSTQPAGPASQLAGAAGQQGGPSAPMQAPDAAQRFPDPHAAPPGAAQDPLTPLAEQRKQRSQSLQRPEPTATLTEAMNLQWFGSGELSMDSPGQEGSWQQSFFGQWLQQSDHSSYGSTPRDGAAGSSAPRLSQRRSVPGADARLSEHGLGDVPGLTDPLAPDRLLGCWSEIVDVVKAEAQAAVDAVSTSIDQSIQGTLGSISAAGRQLAERAQQRGAAAASGAGRAAAEPQDWVLLSPSQQARAAAPAAPAATTAASASQQGPLAPPHTDSVQGEDAPIEIGPLGPVSDLTPPAMSGPSSLPEVMQQVVNDLQAAAADKEAHAGEPGSGPAAAEPLNKEDVAKRLAPTKLCLPGRVMWVFLEDQDTIWDALQSKGKPEQAAGSAGRQSQGSGGGDRPVSSPRDAAAATHHSKSEACLPAAAGSPRPQQGGTAAAAAGTGVSASHRPPDPAVAASALAAAADAAAAGATHPHIPHAQSTPAIASHPVDIRNASFRAEDSFVARVVGSLGSEESKHEGTPREGSSESAGLSNRLSFGFRQLKDSIDQILGKNTAPEAPRAASPVSGAIARAAAAGSGEDVKGDQARWTALGMPGVLEGSGQQPMVCLMEADKSLFDELCLVTSCATDHIPDAYYHALKQLHLALMTGRTCQPNAAGVKAGSKAGSQGGTKVDSSGSSGVPAARAVRPRPTSPQEPPTAIKQLTDMWSVVS